MDASTIDVLVTARPFAPGLLSRRATEAGPVFRAALVAVEHYEDWRVQAPEPIRCATHPGELAPLGALRFHVLELPTSSRLRVDLSAYGEVRASGLHDLTKHMLDNQPSACSTA